MIDISVKDLVKSFDSERNVLDGISFDVQEGERVGLLGKNGAGKTTLFKILTGELDYNSGEIAFASGKKVGLISQIPVYPAGYTVDDVLRTAFAQLDRIRVQMQAIEAQMSDHTPQELLSRYDELMNRFTAGGGYEADTETDKICNGLAISSAQRGQEFASLSGGEKTRVNLARLLLERTDILLLDEPTNHLDMNSVEWLEDYIEKFTANWDVERIVFMDNLIIGTAMAELTSFPSVPVKVTLDEWIEISKYYSTPGSSTFINGVLDKIVESLTAEGRIKKAGRGLI